MAARQGLSHINLLPKDSFEFSALGRILKWTTTVGRVLVVMTELVVILAFISRFYFDKRINDLDESITAKVGLIKAYKETEDDIRRVLTKQKVVTDYLSNNLNFNNKVGLIGGVMPNGGSLSTMAIKGKEVSIKGSVGSEGAFSQMLKGLKKEKTLKQLSLDLTTYDQESGKVNFNIRVTYK